MCARQKVERQRVEISLRLLHMGLAGHALPLGRGD
jgi:hypothetical protein